MNSFDILTASPSYCYNNCMNIIKENLFCILIVRIGGLSSRLSVLTPELMRSVY